MSEESKRVIPGDIVVRNLDAPGTPLVSKVALEDLEELAQRWGVSIGTIDKAMAEFERISTSSLNRALVDQLLPGVLAKS